MTFEKAVEIILIHEGGYNLDKNDRGGETRFGISKASYPNIDIRNLTVIEAKKIYFDDYWRPIRAMELPIPLRLTVFDCAVNQGLPTAIRLLQAAAGAEADGVLGERTLEACNLNAIKTMKAFNKLRLRKYQSHPQWDEYGKGWSARLLDISMNIL